MALASDNNVITMLNKVIDVSMVVFLFGDVTGYTTTLIETFILVVW